MDETLSIKIKVDSDEAQKDIQDTKGEVKGLGEQSEKTEKAVDEAFSAAAGAIKTSMKAVAAAIAAGTAAVIGLAESTRDYRTAQAKLVTSFNSVGASAELANNVYSELQATLGDSDVAVEAAAHLAKLTQDEQALSEWTDICTGVFATFGDSLPIEGLTEAANETAKVGTLTGSLADALNWAGVNEEDFQKKLDACNSEAEREATIRKTLNGLYKNASTNYKLNNKDLIAANKAQEKLNKSMADIGETVEPVLTELKELGASLLEDCKEPLKAVASFISGVVIPAIKAVSSWVKNNKALVIGMVTGLTTAFVGYKVATLAAKAAEEGITIATMARTAAQTALNAVMAANPVGLFVTGIAALTAGLIAWGVASDDAEKETKDYTQAINDMNGAVITVKGSVAELKTEEDYLKTASDNAAAAIKGQKAETVGAKDETVYFIDKVVEITEDERILAEKAAEVAKQFREQKTATNEACGEINSQMTYVTTLADELFRLADNSGKVKKADEERAKFIINELNKHLGTEYELTNGIVKNYQDLEKEIYDVIKAKTAQMLLDENQDDYLAAIKARDGALKAAQTTYQDYVNTLATNAEKIKDIEADIADYEKKRDNAIIAGSIQVANTYDKKVKSLQEEKKALEKNNADKKKLYDDAVKSYSEYTATIINYEDAMVDMQEGNYDAVISMYVGQAVAAQEYSGTLDEETKKNLDTLYNTAIKTKIEAERIKTNFESGVEGYTWEMCREADAAYVAAFKEWNNAYDEAYGIGKNMDAGLRDGLESQRQSLINKMVNISNAVLNATKKAFGINSPSKKTRAMGVNLGEGAKLGIDDSAKGVITAAKDMANDALVPMRAIINDVSWSDFGGIFDTTKLKAGALNGSLKINNNLTANNLVNDLLSAFGAVNTPVVLQVDGKVFGETSINTINQITKQTGKLNLNLA